MSVQNTIELMGFPTTLGLPRQAYRHGPEALRRDGLIQRLNALGCPVIDLGDVTPPEGNPETPVAVRVEQVVEAARWQAETWLQRHRPGNLMLTLGGDHSASLGTLWALAQMNEPFDVVWVDAHGDFNVIETSPTGNPHGMVLALACGLMPQFMPKILEPTDIHLWGIRDLDEGEQALLRQFRAEVLSPGRTLTELEAVVSRLKRNLFISFDVDSVEPWEAPGTMTPVPGGFRTEEALALIALMARQRRILALDVVEFHPDLDQFDRTLQLAREAILSAVTGRVPERVRRRR